MKKTIVLLISFFLLLWLSSCATVKRDVEFSQDRTNVQSIAIYHPERAYYEGDIHTFLEENDAVKVLESANFASFLDALCDLEFKEEKVFFPIPMDGGYDYDGYMIAIVFSDGGYDIIAEGGSYSYEVGDNGQGRHKYDHSDYCGELPWANFVEKYIET